MFTVEYSVRAAQMAVYKLLKVQRPVSPVTRYDKSISVLLDSLEKAFVCEVPSVTAWRRAIRVKRAVGPKASSRPS